MTPIRAYATTTAPHPARNAQQMGQAFFNGYILSAACTALQVRQLLRSG
jgi:hypothetical protein